MKAPGGLFRAGAMVLLTGASACSLASEEETLAQSSEIGAFDAELVRTDQSNAKLLASYDAALDKVGSPCVEAVDDGTGAAPLNVGRLEYEVEMKLVKSKSDLERTLVKKRSVSAGFSLGGFGVSVNASKDLRESYRESRRAVHFLLTAHASYEIDDTRAVRLTSAARKMLATKDPAFLAKCGTGFVRGAVYGGMLHVLVRFEARDVEQAKAVRRRIGVGLTFDNFGVSASFGKYVKDVLGEHTSSARFTVALDGFLAPSDAASLTDAGADNAALAKLDGLRKNLADSVLTDLCADGGSVPGVACTPRASAARTTDRDAVAIAIRQGKYQTALNRPADPDGTLYATAFGDRAAAVSRYLTTYGALADRAFEIYAGEIAPYLTAGSTGRARFGLASRVSLDRVPMETSDLDRIASYWADELRVRDAGQVGRAVQPLLGAMDACRVAASRGGYGPCLVDPASEGPYKAALEVLGRYEREGRILPTTFTSTEPSGAFDLAKKCAPGSRLATRDEVARVGPAIAAFGVKKGSTDDGAYRVYFAESVFRQAPCTTSAMSFFNAPGDGMNATAAFSCVQGDRRPSIAGPQLASICVPANGPFEGD